MSGHTPGKWFTTQQGHSTIYVEARIGGGMLQEVAACGPTEAWQQQEANARLIAAAPELLEALKFFVYHPGVTHLCTANSKAMVDAVAAIAKATGDQP
jgi:hypothetical protein